MATSLNTPTEGQVDMSSRASRRLPYTYSPTEGRWIQPGEKFTTEQDSPSIESLSVANYNINAEFPSHPTQARYPIIVQNILDSRARADILVIEGVTNELLSYLCNDPEVRDCYLFFSNGPPDQSDIDPLPNDINAVVLSKWLFSWASFLLPETCYGSVILEFANIGNHGGEGFTAVVLCVVHLAPGFTDAAIETKTKELSSILRHLSQEYPRSPCILAGNFNIPTSIYTIETAVKENKISLRGRALLAELEAMPMNEGLLDAWVSACAQDDDDDDNGNDDVCEWGSRQQDFEKALGGEKGATFDPAVNSLAIHDNFNKRPQRYNRILVKREGITVTGFNMFGHRMGVPQTDVGVGQDDSSNVQLSHGSDHWGIRCSLKIFTGSPNPPAESSSAISPSLEVKQDVTTSKITAYLSEQSVFPSGADVTTRNTALSLLKEAITQDEDNLSRGSPTFILVPVGSYGLGVWTTASDINCLCIGRISPKTFFALVIQRLRRAASRGIKILRRVDCHSSPILELAIGHIKMDLQYCSAVSVAETWPTALTLPPSDPVFKLPQSALTTLKPVRDLAYLRRTIPDLDAFRISYHFIKCWAKRRGIYAAEFGYLSGIQVSILLSRVCKLLLHKSSSVSVQTILRTFYHHYAEFPWDKSMVFDPFFHKRPSYVRTAREPMVILGFHGPRLNTAQSTTASTAHTIITEIKKADEALSKPWVAWTELLDADTSVRDFLHSHSAFIKITARFWDVSPARINKDLEWLESKCAALLVDIGRLPSGIRTRFWPGRFVSQDASEVDQEYEGCYLIGLDVTPKTNFKREDLHVYTRALETEARDNAKYFDAKSCWLNIDIVPQREVVDPRLDSRDWGKYIVEGEDEDIGDSEFWASMEADEAKEAPTKKETRLTHKPTYEGKLRSAGDVLNRLRWDQAMDSSDYIIGYEDRFSGAMERSVDSWKSDTTHEEFIPEHRILYFKRKSDGTVVWDREERRDEIFGSGASSLGR
ncbi:hypothetical protein F5Y11DRAFT_328689 [Daldinia sp. FL1419]|nr:hypothetical protein F5Y11DRAFT_328689 [Daldinia sp. FL1419]